MLFRTKRVLSSSQKVTETVREISESLITIQREINSESKFYNFKENLQNLTIISEAVRNAQKFSERP